MPQVDLLKKYLAPIQEDDLPYWLLSFDGVEQEVLPVNGPNHKTYFAASNERLIEFDGWNVVGFKGFLGLNNLEVKYQGESVIISRNGAFINRGKCSNFTTTAVKGVHKVMSQECIIEDSRYQNDIYLSGGEIKKITALLGPGLPPLRLREKSSK